MNEEVQLSWNYRVLRSNENGDPYYRVVEVYYSKVTGEPLGWCESKPAGGSLDTLQADMKYYAEALAKPVLSEGDFPE